MPLPLLFLVPSVAAGIYGAAKGVKAVVDQAEAKETNESAERTVARAKSFVEETRKSTNATLEDYGSRKLRAFNGPISEFIDTFSRLRNVEEIHTPELEKLQLGDFSTDSLNSLKKDFELLTSSGLGLGAGLSGGAALAFGAYNGTMLLATASTGTAISTLSGVAATNATLAWLGGGSIAAGGGGMALGTAVLGGVVAGPALAIMGFIVGNKAEAALADAQSNREKAISFAKESKLAAEKLQAIAEVTSLANSTFSKVTSRLRKSVRELQHVIDQHGEDYKTYTQESRAIVFRSVKFAQLIKAMIDTPILDENGALVLSTEKKVQEVTAVLEQRT